MVDYTPVNETPAQIMVGIRIYMENKLDKDFTFKKIESDISEV